MNSTQYEELCRYFVAEKSGIDVEKIRSVRVQNPTRPGMPQYKHQIDLYWETDTELSLYLNITNAKWRGSDAVDQPEVLLLQKVKEKIAAHKAFMLTNTGFTSGAEAVAKDEGIALYVVLPNFDCSLLPRKGRSDIMVALQQLAATSSQPVYRHEIIHKAYDFSDVSMPENRLIGGGSPRIAVASNYSTKVSPSYSTKTVGNFSTKRLSDNEVFE
jgi:hypothetical protein